MFPLEENEISRAGRVAEDHALEAGCFDDARWRLDLRAQDRSPSVRCDEGMAQTFVQPFEII